MRIETRYAMPLQYERKWSFLMTSSSRNRIESRVPISRLPHNFTNYPHHIPRKIRKETQNKHQSEKNDESLEKIRTCLKLSTCHSLFFTTWSFVNTSIETFHFVIQNASERHGQLGILGLKKRHRIKQLNFCSFLEILKTTSLLQRW